MTRNQKIYRDVQIGKLTNELRKIERELLEKEMNCYDIAERYGTNSYQYEAMCRLTIAVRAEIEEVRNQLDEYLQAY